MKIYREWLAGSKAEDELDRKYPIYSKIKSILAILLALILVLLGAFVAPISSGAISNNITIISPIDETITASEFMINVLVLNDTTDSVQAHISGYPWVNLVYDGSNEWAGLINVSAIPNGQYSIQAMYRIPGELPYESPKIPITINKPAVIPQYGSITITVLDTNSRPVQGVTVTPGNNITDGNGVVFVGHQPLTTNINFTLTKSGYNTTYLDVNFIDSNTITRTVTMGKVGGDKREFTVSGYETMMVGRGNFIIVHDSVTGEKVDGASIILYDGANVKSLPGETVNGRLFVSIPAESISGDYLIEVTKSGYNDWSDTFTAWAAPATLKPTTTPAPTPTPSPTPVPTVSKTFRADVCEKMKVCESITDDEYRERLVVLESWNRNQTLSNASIYVQQPKTETFPWIPALLGVGGLAALGVKKRDEVMKIGSNLGSKIGLKKSAEPEQIRQDIINHSEQGEPINNESAVVSEGPPEKTEVTSQKNGMSHIVRVKCDAGCDWSTLVDESKVNEVLAVHKKTEHNIITPKKAESK